MSDHPSQHIYHTVGIEGNTMTLAQTRSVLETKLAVGGKSVMEHNEVLGLDAALKYVNQTLVDKVGDLSLQDILEIHKRVIGYVDPIEVLNSIYGFNEDLLYDLQFCDEIT